MIKEKRLLIIGLCVLVIVVGITTYFLIPKEKQIDYAPNDEMLFKKEYELINGKSNNDKEYLLLEIKEDTGVKYIGPDEAVELIANGNGIIYFGFPTCPWCRNMLPVLLNALESNGINKFYYMNILDIRSTYVLDGDNKPKIENEGTVGYYKILDVLKDKLTDYTLTISEGKKAGEKVKTGELRLFAPTVVFVRDGIIVDIHIGTVESQTDPHIPLTKEQKEELNEIFTNGIKKVNAESCN